MTEITFNNLSNTTVSDNSSINCSHHLMVRIQDFHSWHTSSILVESTKDNVRVLVFSHINDEVIRIKRGTILDTPLTLSIASIAQLVRAPDC